MALNTLALRMGMAALHTGSGPGFGEAEIDALNHMPEGQMAILSVTITLLLVALMYRMRHPWLAVLFVLLAIGNWGRVGARPVPGRCNLTTRAHHRLSPAADANS